MGEFIDLAGQWPRFDMMQQQKFLDILAAGKGSGDRIQPAKDRHNIFAHRI